MIAFGPWEKHRAGDEFRWRRIETRGIDGRQAYISIYVRDFSHKWTLCDVYGVWIDHFSCSKYDNVEASPIKYILDEYIVKEGYNLCDRKEFQKLQLLQ